MLQGYTGYGGGAYGATVNPGQQGQYDPQFLLGQGQLANEQRGQDIGRQNALTAIQPAMTGEANRMTRFNDILPLLQHGFSQFANSMMSGAPGAPPPINVGPVWDAQQQQARINQSNAQGQQATATQIHNMQSQLAGRGFGANSPLEQSLQANMQMGGMGQNQANATNLRTNMAQANAQQNLASQQAASNQYIQNQQLGLTRQRNFMDYNTQFLNALSGLV